MKKISLLSLSALLLLTVVPAFAANETAPKESAGQKMENVAAKTDHGLKRAADATGRGIRHAASKTRTGLSKLKHKIHHKKAK